MSNSLKTLINNILYYYTHTYSVHRTILIANIKTFPQGYSTKPCRWDKCQVKSQSLCFHQSWSYYRGLTEQPYRLASERGGPILPSPHLVTCLKTHPPPITVQARTLPGISFTEWSRGCRCSKLASFSIIHPIA